MAQRMKRASGKLTYANVISTICLFLLLGGGAAYAASHLGKNSVGPKQLKKNSVTNAKIKANAITTPKIKEGAVTGAKVLDGSLTGAKVLDRSLTGADIDQGTLTSVRASNITTISIGGDESCSPALPLPSGVTSSHLSKGTCKITFPSAITSCSESVTVHLRSIKNPVVGAPRLGWILEPASEPNVLFVDTYLGETKTDLPFDLIIVC
jgi:hypothetical protein